jgi:cytochrome c oxidase assembly factor CtaG
MDMLAWTFDPTVIVGLLLAAGLYWRGLARMRRMRAAGFAAWRPWAFGAGLAILAIALLSPIATYDGHLFALHMTQHLMIAVAAPPLLLLGAPLVPFLWGLPTTERRGLGRLLVPGRPLHVVLHALTTPWLAVVVFLVTLSVWHVPALYDAAQGRSAAHVLEHALLIGTGMLFWWPIVHPSGGQRRLGYGIGIAYVFAAALQSNAVGALLTFAGRPLYQTYIDAPRISPLSPLEDQQLGGLIMWVPGGMFWLLPLFVLLALFLRDEDRRQTALEAELTRRAGDPPAV